ncbi:MAG: hypothetical protein JWL59_3 [Chthoniobacteraceae bacterium]|nr:hypothetical protein [Chthoniobacteraceae bacterium]
MSKSSKLIELRARIQQHLSAPPAQHRAYLETGVPSLDKLLAGGLWKGGIVELTCEAKTSGASFLMRTILRHAAKEGRWSALIDGSDSFDPQSAGAQMLKNLLWIRCKKAGDAIRSVDLLLRDGNLPLLFLDLRGNPATELAAISSSNWYRLQRAIEPTSVALVALTPRPLIMCADVRLLLEGHFKLASLDDEQEVLLPQLSLSISRKRSATRWTEQMEAAV